VRWPAFRVLLLLLYAGVVFDVLTTALGFRVDGSGYESNPVTKALIVNLGWFGLLAYLTVFCLAIYHAGRVVRLEKPGWVLAMNVVLVPITLVRWSVVGLTCLYLTGHL
jgi:hypothetical protein